MNLGWCDGCSHWRVVTRVGSAKRGWIPVLRRHDPCGRVRVEAGTKVRPL